LEEAGRNARLFVCENWATGDPWRVPFSLTSGLDPPCIGLTQALSEQPRKAGGADQPL